MCIYIESVLGCVYVLSLRWVYIVVSTMDVESYGVAEHRKVLLLSSCL